MRKLVVLAASIGAAGAVALAWRDDVRDTAPDLADAGPAAAARPAPLAPAAPSELVAPPAAPELRAAVAPSRPPTSPLAPPALAGRTHAEIRTALFERSRERAVAEGKLRQLEEREARRAAERDRRFKEGEARRAEAHARMAQAEEDAGRILSGQAPAPQLRTLAGASAVRSSSVVQQQRAAMGTHHVPGGR